MKKVLLLSVLCFSHFLWGNILLESPRNLSEQDIENLCQSWSTTFEFICNHKIQLVLKYKDGHSSVLLKRGLLPIQQYNFNWFEHFKDYVLRKIFKISYLISESLVASNNQPQAIHTSDLLNMITHKKSFFYTGAGISAGHVPTILKLKELLGFHESSKFNIQKVIDVPDVVAQGFGQFCKNCMYAEPTAAHFALSKIAQYLSCAVITENFDLLHQRTYTEPLHTCCRRLHHLKIEDVQAVDYIVCIGLSSDDRGLLGFCKKHNPDLKIISIDFEVPSYLSENDYFLQGDAQIVLPLLARGLGL